MKKTTKKSASPTTAKAAPAPTVATPPVTAKPAVVAASPAPVKSVSTPAKSLVGAATPPVTIEAKVDIGFGNKLFVRGQGGGLSWERGLPLENVDSQTWRLTVPARDSVQFKLLINDSVWAQGEDLVAAPGKKVEVTPAF